MNTTTILLIITGGIEMTNEDFKKETIAMLRIMKANCRRGNEPAQVIIDDMSEETFLWAINQAIAQIKDGKPDYKDI